MKSSDPERFKNLTAGWQSIAVTVAVVLSGCWALFTFAFVSEPQIRIAAESLKKAQLEAQAEARLEIGFEIKQLTAQGDAPKPIVGTLSAKNVGTTSASLDFSEKPIQVFKVTFDHDAEKWTQVSQLGFRGGASSPVGGIYVELGTTKYRSFATVLSGPGLYVVTANGTQVVRTGDGRTPPTKRGYYAQSNYLLIE